ncbi:hypothetical protein DMN91_000503 [Ooceraea biroi]|uniref:C2H2-type domain-containing protein n=1 Tax=Ooceraea biroi TaxID=2015173 RepID=A0A3L8E241_OOCBI|nr:hypothetical protein DMN91_000503 [Ooceraea biroi]
MSGNVATIKLEEGQESVTEIQTYLETFNKEIEGGQGEQLQHVQLQQVEGLSGGEEGGTYFVDQSGQYYYQANSDEAPVMTQVQIQEVEESDVQNEGELAQMNAAQDEQYQEIEELENVEGDEDEQVGNGENNQVVINSGDAYQTVTIVPSDTNPGEVSYVLIVQQPEADEKESKSVEGEIATATATGEGEEAEGEQDLTVYDFEDNEDNEAPVESETEDDKTKIVKFLPKKSQTVTQAHMCNYCNYTSPKRYLLSRHMKSHSEERPHKCSVCERGFKTLASLQNHVNTHTGTKPHRCKFCDSAFTTSAGNKPVFHCELCPATCGRKTDLRIHVQKLHTSDKPLKCKRCGKTFRIDIATSYNSKTHEGEKCYKCDLQKQLLKRHSNLYHNPAYIPPPPQEKTHQCPSARERLDTKEILFDIWLYTTLSHLCKRNSKLSRSVDRKRSKLSMASALKWRTSDARSLSQESGIVTGTGEEVDEVEEEALEMQDLKIEAVTPPHLKLQRRIPKAIQSCRKKWKLAWL